MKLWAEFTAELTEAEMLLIIADYKEFRKMGAIGECFLRSKAEEWSDNVGTYGISVVSTMIDLATFAYQYFAERYFEIAGLPSVYKNLIS